MSPGQKAEGPQLPGYMYMGATLTWGTIKISVPWPLCADDVRDIEERFDLILRMARSKLQKLEQDSKPKEQSQ